MTHISTITAPRWPVTASSNFDPISPGISRTYAKGAFSMPYIYNLSKQSTELHSFTGFMPFPAQAGIRAMILKLQPEKE